jgi:hypothetical protein
MPQSKRYGFTFSFVFDGEVDDRFIPDLRQLNEGKLRKLGYQTSMDAEKRILASVESGKILDFTQVGKVTQQELLHYQLSTAMARLNNTLLPSPDQKQQKLGEFKYRDGDWLESYMETDYQFHAEADRKIVMVTAVYREGQNLGDWARDLVFVIQSAQHSAFLASRIKELSYAMRGTDEGFMIAAQGKLMAAIAFRLV